MAEEYNHRVRETQPYQTSHKPEHATLMRRAGVSRQNERRHPHKADYVG